MSVFPIGTRRRLMRHPFGWIAAGFGAGFSPKAPGTVGTAVAVIVWWFALKDLPMLPYLIVLASAFLIGVFAAQWVIRRTGVEDPSLVVWDEFVGVWITLMFAPSGWYAPLLGFIVFRVFDIWKPWPVSWADRELSGGFGTMVDDAIAGIYALAVVQSIFYGLGWL